MAKTINVTVSFSFDELRKNLYGTARHVIEKAKDEGREEAFLGTLEAMLVGEPRTIENIERLISGYKYEF